MLNRDPRFAKRFAGKRDTLRRFESRSTECAVGIRLRRCRTRQPLPSRKPTTSFSGCYSAARTKSGLCAKELNSETRPRYTPSSCFETFPFPEPTADQEAAISAAAKELDELRSRWLNPPEWTRTQVLEFPGSVDGPWARYVAEPDARGIGTVRWPRLVPNDADCAASLKKRTLTNLYNERPAWLDLAHKKLDAAVFAAYGWDAGMSDEELLERLLNLNLGR